jgi:hypothetical protein
MNRQSPAAPSEPQQHAAPAAYVRLATPADIDALVETAARAFLENPLHHYCANARLVRRPSSRAATHAPLTYARSP